MFSTHKPGQGVIVRRCAYGILAVLIVWGGQSLYTWLIGRESLGMANLVLGTPEDGGKGWVIPVFNQRFNWAFVTSWAVVILSLVGLHRFLNRPKSAEFLIETDAEVKKVTWPSWKDAWSSTVIVLVFVFVLTAFLVLSDKVIDVLFGLLLGGDKA